MKTLLIPISIMFIFSGCATGASKHIRQNKNEGRVMLIGTGTWMEPNSMKHAETEINKKCPNGYEIIEEGLMERPSDVSLSNKTHAQEKYLEYKCK